MKTFSKAELDAARKRLDEAQGITDEVVEIGARAIMDMEIGLTCVRLPSGELVPWNEWSEDAKEERRKVVREVLRAILPMRVNAVHGITDEMTEAAARAMYERKRSLLEGIKPLPWDAIPRFAQDEWREIARAGLKAAGTVTAVHLCDTCASFKVCFFRRLFQSLIDEEAPPVRVRACVTECEQYKPDARVQEVLAGARQGSTSQG